MTTVRLRVYVPPHPLIKHWLAIARDVSTPPALFRSAMTELGRWLTYEATKEWFSTVDARVQTPLTECSATYINPEVPMVVVPILRAGLALMEGIQSVVPLASVYHLGMVRNEETLEVRCYLNKLPEKFDPQTRLIISEPMLATGGTIMATMKELTDRGIDVSLMRIVSVVAAPQALQRLSQEYPSLQVYTGIIDEGLNDKGFIVPGLGDAGDRTFGT
jgi:uracil phosphoribosyltransferase